MSQFPTLDPGVTFLDAADAPTALYRIVGDHLGAESGPTYWVDARNAAVPASLREFLPESAIRRLRVARAFTGYQHYELVRSLPATADRTTDLVVAPNVSALYEDGDVPPAEARTMFEATTALLDATSRALDVPVLVTAPGARRETQVRTAADRVVEAERTRAGLAVSGESFQPEVYWHEWGFQTTIPYWVDLLEGGMASEVAAGVGVGIDHPVGPTGAPERHDAPGTAWTEG